jgi:hypothetical protein
MCYVIDKWSEEIVKMDYIPEYSWTAIEHRNVSEFNPHVKDKPGHTLAMFNVTGSCVGVKLWSCWPTRPSKSAWNVVPARSNGDE